MDILPKKTQPTILQIGNKKKIIRSTTFVNDEPDMCEPEHKDSCDINKMIGSIFRGQEVRGRNNQAVYGYDDTTMTGVDFRIQKAELEKQLSSTAENHEFTKEELELIPSDVKSKFNFKQKADPKTPPTKRDELNDAKTGGNQPQSNPDDSLKNTSPPSGGRKPSESAAGD